MKKTALATALIATGMVFNTVSADIYTESDTIEAEYINKNQVRLDSILDKAWKQINKDEEFYIIEKAKFNYFIEKAEALIETSSYRQSDKKEMLNNLEYYQSVTNKYAEKNNEVED